MVPSAGAWLACALLAGVSGAAAAGDGGSSIPLRGGAQSVIGCNDAEASGNPARSGFATASLADRDDRFRNAAGDDSDPARCDADPVGDRYHTVATAAGRPPQALERRLP